MLSVLDVIFWENRGSSGVQLGILLRQDAVAPGTLTRLTTTSHISPSLSYPLVGLRTHSAPTTSNITIRKETSPTESGLSSRRSTDGVVRLGLPTLFPFTNPKARPTAYYPLRLPTSSLTLSRVDDCQRCNVISPH